MIKSSYRHDRPTLGVLPGWRVYTGAGPDYFLTTVMRGLQAAVRERGCNLLMACGVWLPWRPVEYSNLIQIAWPTPLPECDFVPVGPWNTDGLAVIPPLLIKEQWEYIRQVQAEGMPVVYCGAERQGPMVMADNEGGIRRLLMHLVVTHGHRRIAYVGGQTNYWEDSQLRFDAFRIAMQEFGLEVDPRLVGYVNHDLHNKDRLMQEAMQRILDQRTEFTAVVADNDACAIQAIKALRQAGRRVPEDVAVVGFDNIPLAASQVSPLTTVQYPMFETGYRAGLLLDDWLHGHPPADKTVYLPARLVIRKSCGCQLGQPVKVTPAETSPAIGELKISIENPSDILARKLAAAIAVDGYRISLGGILPDCQNLAQSFLVSLDGAPDNRFHRALVDLLERIQPMTGDEHLWTTTISTIENHISEWAQSLITASNSSTVTELLRETWFALYNQARQHHSEYFEQQIWDVDQITSISAYLQASKDEQQILKVLAENLPKVGIRFAIVAFFEPDGYDIAAWSFVQSPTVSQETVPSENGIRFPSREFPPIGLVEEPFQLALLPLTIQEKQVGYVAFEAGNLAACPAVLLPLATAFHSARLYREATEGRRLAEEANRLKSRFLSTVSHELRTPLNLIVGLSEMLLADEDQSGEPLAALPYREELSKIHASAQHLEWLIRDVLDLARSDVGQLKLMCEPLNLVESLNTVIQMGEHLAQEKGLTWETRLPSPDQSPRVWGDRTRLRQVALNLISNAVKFTPQGTVRLEIALADGKAEVRVGDTGLGIPLAEQEVIFDEFHQSERTTMRGYGGLGLGLAICRRLVELHGGQIGVRSSGEEGAGSTFYFTLPLWIGDQLDLEPVEAGSLPTVFLLVKDREGQERLCESLQKQGFTVKAHHLDVAGNWMVSLRTAMPEAVVLDAPTAIERGWEVLKMMRDNPALQDIPILFYSLAPDQDHGSLLTMDYLTKPMNARDLARVLSHQGWLAEADRPKTILMVDDEPGILEMHAQMVQSQSPDSRVLQARNGREALEQLGQMPVDLVLLDLMMPELDGFGVLQAMREKESTRDIPVIVLTAQALTETDMARLNRGVATVLEKGVFSLEETLAHIGKVLQQQRNWGNDAKLLVWKAMAYLHTHYFEAITREDVARHVGISEDYLSRCFQKVLGISVMIYLARFRVSQAKRLLAESDKSVTVVALETGFESERHFFRIFRREAGMTPGAYRRGQQKG